MKPIAVIGAGFTGLTAAIELARAGKPVMLFERDDDVGGLAGSFKVNGEYDLEKFYHHWFTNDRYIIDQVRQLGLESNMIKRASRTGMYYNNSMYRLSTPLDVIRFDALNFIDRIRMGLLVFQARAVRDWKSIEHLNVREWLIGLCGEQVYKVVWEPLIRAKFSVYAEDLSATWFWKKLQLRGSSRNNAGGEALAYYQGGFAALANSMRKAAEDLGCEIRLNQGVSRIIAQNGTATHVETDGGEKIEVSAVLATPAFPIIADMLEGAVGNEYLSKLRRVNYLANKCLVLLLDRSLSETYWLNVNDPEFPFVGVIEHTNFEPVESYGGRHVVYMSRYLPHTDPVYDMSSDALLDYAEPFIKRMFPDFSREWVMEAYSWRARYAQPVTERNYSEYVPAENTPLQNFWISTMAQVYPEDRGTNYAIREGKAVANTLLSALQE
jgi:protoporphyrinogen oxidase